MNLRKMLQHLFVGYDERSERENLSLSSKVILFFWYCIFWGEFLGHLPHQFSHNSFTTFYKVLLAAAKSTLHQLCTCFALYICDHVLYGVHVHLNTPYLSVAD